MNNVLMLKRVFTRHFIIISAWYIVVECLLSPLSYASTEMPSRHIVTVRSIEEFVDAIDSNRIIRLEPELYLHPGKFSTFPTIHDVENLKIVGIGEKPVQLLASSPFQAVLSFHNVKNIILENLEIGHAKGVTSDCYGGVVSFTNSNNIAITNSILFGSGTEGLTLRNVQGLTFYHSLIKDCTWSIMTINTSSNIRFENSQFIHNRVWQDSIKIYGSHEEEELIETSEIQFVNCDFSYNTNDIRRNTSLFAVNSTTKNIVVSNSTIHGNVLGHLVSGDVQFTQCTFTDNYFKKGIYHTPIFLSDRSEYRCECVQDQQPDDPSFVISQERNNQNTDAEVITISILDSEPIYLGRLHSLEEGRYYPRGIEVKSIRVHKLPGTPELFHIEWLERSYDDYAMNCHYSIRLAENPEKKILNGVLQLYVRDSYHPLWVSIWGNYHIQYKNDTIGFQAEIEKIDSAPTQPQPLYHQSPVYIGQYTGRITVRLHRKYRLKDENLTPITTILEYKLQDGDTLNDVCEGLEVNSEWIQSSESLPKPGEWITIIIPNDLSEDHYPHIVKELLGERRTL